MADLESLTKLTCWQGSIVTEPIGGGITNENYIVRDGERICVARICFPLPHLGIDRRNEVVCQQAAHDAGVAPTVVHNEPGILVSAFIDARTLTADDLRDAARLGRLAKTLRSLHDGWDRLEGEMLYFSPFQTVRTYAATARRLGARLPDDIGALVEDAGRLERRMSPFTPTLCHNDLLPANILESETSLWLVDWEYAGVGNPLFDLAGVSANAALDDEAENALLTHYRGVVREQDRRELRILKTVSLLREALWAVIQTVKSTLDFDYAKYANDNLEAYRNARREIRT